MVCGLLCVVCAVGVVWLVVSGSRLLFVTFDLRFVVCS